MERENNQFVSVPNGNLNRRDTEWLQSKAEAFILQWAIHINREAKQSYYSLFLIKVGHFEKPLNKNPPLNRIKQLDPDLILYSAVRTVSDRSVGQA